MAEPKKRRRKEHHGPSIANALIIYGVVPVILFIAYSYIDEGSFGLLNSLRVKKNDNNYSNLEKNHEVNVPLGYGVDELKGKDDNSRQKIREQTMHNPSRETSNLLNSPIDAEIHELRKEFEQNPDDYYKALSLAEMLLQRDLQHHDGGTVQSEAIQTFLLAIELIEKKRDSMLRRGSGVRHQHMSINEEMMLRREEKSVQALLVGAYCNLSNQYFMANMFEKAVASADSALKMEPDCLEALRSRASSSVILGKYDDAGHGYSRILEIDSDRNMIDAFTGVVKVLKAKEDSILNGWTKLVDIMTPLISLYEQNLERLGGSSAQTNNQLRMVLTVRLKTMYFAMSAYHEYKTGDTDLAWHYLTLASKYKMAVLPPYDEVREDKNIAVIKSIFVDGFWPQGVGSTSRKPIFIVGFPRSGSTLLERILDAHPQIVGTGEDSVFNGMLSEVRDGIIQASSNGSLSVVVQTFANRIDKITKERWIELERNSNEEGSSVEPAHYVDKMLSNYLNIGFIHMLYPNALIFHISREPMDTVYSSFKHEFPPGKLDYTSDFQSLAHMYRKYREIMDHWDRHLPGRVIHIRYEDIVRDKTDMAKSIIAATGLDWDDDIMNFHKKKQAVNTHSTTQVRRGIYKDSLQTWKRFENYLLPLAKLLGADSSHKYKTSLPGYKR